MKNTLLAIAITALTTLSIGAQAQTPGPISLAQAAELSAHRVDRLVVIGKIDANFSKRLASIEISRVMNAPPTAFRALVSQTSPTTDPHFKLKLL